MNDKYLVHNLKTVAGSFFLFIGFIGVFTILENMFHQVQVNGPIIWLSLSFVCMGILVLNLKVK